jgi:hypothetical protein
MEKNNQYIFSCFSNVKMDPGTRVVVTHNDQIVVKGELYIVFSYINDYTVIGTNDDHEYMFGIMDASVLQPYHPPQGPLEVLEV